MELSTRPGWHSSRRDREARPAQVVPNLVALQVAAADEGAGAAGAAAPVAAQRHPGQTADARSTPACAPPPTCRRRGCAPRDLLRDPSCVAAPWRPSVWMSGYALSPPWGTRGPWLTLSLAYVVPIAAAVALTCWAAVRSTGRARWFWGLLALQRVLARGRAHLESYELQGEAPFPSLADAFYLACYATVVPAVVVGFGAGWLRVSRSLLDASVIAASLGLLGWQVLIEPQLVGGADLATAVGVAYPLLGVVSIVVVGVLGYGSSGRCR
jgi:hypothetical protein